MKLEISQPDELMVLTTTKYVVENANYVHINEVALKNITEVIKKRLEQGLEPPENSFGIKGKNLEEDARLIFLEDTINFCFWAEKGKEKWEVEYPKGVRQGGYYSLVSCFKRALDEGIPILDLDYLIDLDKEKVAYFLRSSNGVEIPLLEKRLENLKEAGMVLKEKFKGQFLNVIKEAEFDAVKLVKLIYDNFSSFRDIALYKGQTIYFLKRAQILANDINYLHERYNFSIKNIDKLTAFADYKIPQILRHFDVLKYEKELADKIDNYEIIPANSEYEIEIRASAIWAVELIKQNLNPIVPSSIIDNVIWLISQNQEGLKPYHRTLTWFY